MIYRGKINKYTDAGLFYTSFIDVDGGLHYIVATHMENGFGAKSVFPCIDDPSFKAHFQITLAYPAKGYVPLSNTLEYYGSSIGNGYNQVRFPKTLLMSTYLVAFSTGEFVSKAAYTPDNVLVRSWAWIGMEDYLEFAANTSAQCLYRMSQYVNFTFPMDKTDQLGLPEFPAGAMENYGLIIYKYQYIAYNPKVHTTFNKFSAIRVMCHELSHQWFGDTVTAMWWDDLFLHEGFAQYWEYNLPEMTFPGQNMFLDSYFVSDIEEIALNSDANPKLSHPVIYKDGPAFDDMTYNKGGSILRMLRQVIGDAAFQNGLRSYIAKYKFQNANHSMLFNELTTAARNEGILDWCNRPIDVSLFLDPWMLQQNFPLISVSHNGNFETLTQTSFSNISTLPVSPYNYSWPIPVYYQEDAIESNLTLGWILPNYENITDCKNPNVVPKYAAGKFQLNNADTWAFARVKYDDDSFQAILSALSSDNEISVISKVRLIHDATTFAQQQAASGDAEAYLNVLDLTNAILPSSDPHPAIFETVQKTIDLLEGLMNSNNQRALYGQFVKATIGPLCNQVGWNTSDSWDLNIARERILPYCVRYNVPGFVKTAMSLYNDLLGACANFKNGTESCNPLHPDIRKAVYCAAAMQSNQNIFTQLISFYVAQYQNDRYFYQEYQALLYGLSCATNEGNLTAVVHHIASSKLVGSTELFYMATNPLACQTLFDYLQNRANFDKVVDAGLMDGYLNTMTYNTFDTEKQKKLEYLHNTYKPYFNAGNKLNSTFHTYLTRDAQQVEWSNLHNRAVLRWMWDNVVIQAPPSPPWTKRLPTGKAKPTNYTLLIQPYLPGTPKMQPGQELTFNAQSTMSFTLLSASNELLLNSHRILFNSINVTIPDDTLEVDPNKIIYDFDNAIITIVFPQVLPANVKLQLSFDYSGFIFGKPNEGADTNTFYNSINGKRGWIFNTDFEGGAGLRSMIPCFDEPDYKAIWQITVKHEKDMVAVSNMPASSSTMPQPGNDWSVTVFEATPEMSSYLVAICVGHFQNIQGTSEGGVLVRIFTWPGMEIYGQTALKTAMGSLDFLGTYFEKPYPLPKLDVVALPEYTRHAHAMENWGLIIGIYSSIILDMDYATTQAITTCVHTVAHETTHQWFGDLVTLDWWSYVFLNEGFAEHWYVNAMNATYPEQAEAVDYIKYSITQRALQDDTDEDDWGPIIVNTSSPDAQPFGPDTYMKGSAMLTHLSTILGDEILRKGIANYVKKHAYANVKIDDLFDSLTQEAQKNGLKDWNNEPLNVATAVDAYFYQIGYPVVQLTTDSKKKTVTYTQSSMVDPETMPPDSPYGYMWNVPLKTEALSGSNFYWLPANETIDRDLGSTWEVDNFQGKGFFRVWYDDATWEPIYKQLMDNASLIDPITRASMFDDAVNLAERGSFDYSRVFDISLYLPQETQYSGWTILDRLALKLKAYFKFQPENPKLLKHLATISAPQQQESVWTQTGNWAQDELSGLLNKVACGAGDAKCLKQVSDRFQRFVLTCQYSNAGTASCENVSPDNRKTMYCTGLAQDSTKFDVIYKLYSWFTKHNHYFDRDANNLLNALTCVQDSKLLDRLSQEVLTGSLPARVFEYISDNDISGTYLYNLLITNKKQVANAPISFKNFVREMINGWNTKEQVKNLDKLSKDDAFDQSQKNVIMESIGQVEIGRGWMKTYGTAIKKWLNAHY
ncbi:hypothetical protein L596_022441 [Steinernema carpocapsae]|uniref:Aminopeptidase n=1 Tax=Steinernema carpocapsae TaxID=34508 RepID=A0A4U5MLR6_STECR|nr:hypothetical protein L596_022441 [Steinernema carpocapsae]